MSSHHLRWKGQVTGPHTLEDIRALLASGEVSRMHQIEHAGQWQSLDEFLRGTEESERAHAAEFARQEELDRRRIERELADYFGGRSTTFKTPLARAGSPFQNAVWDALLRIPPGETWSFEAVLLRKGTAYKPSSMVGL